LWPRLDRHWRHRDGVDCSDLGAAAIVTTGAAAGVTVGAAAGVGVGAVIGVDDVGGAAIFTVAAAAGFTAAAAAGFTAAAAARVGISAVVGVGVGAVVGIGVDQIARLRKAGLLDDCCWKLRKGELCVPVQLDRELICSLDLALPWLNDTAAKKHALKKVPHSLPGRVAVSRHDDGLAAGKRSNADGMGGWEQDLCERLRRREAASVTSSVQEKRCQSDTCVKPSHKLSASCQRTAELVRALGYAAAGTEVCGDKATRSHTARQRKGRGTLPKPLLAPGVGSGQRC
jgi:hypothetical protein